MVEVRLYEERYASLRPSSLYEIGPNTVRRGTTPQPVLTSYKRLEIARNFLTFHQLDIDCCIKFPCIFR
jgi:hypothetical protein